MLEITLAAAIERSAKESPSRGFRFISEAGVPGFSKSEQANAEASFSFSAIERTSARYGAAMQAMGLKKGDRVAFILPENEDFVLCFFGAIRAGIVPVPIYPPFGLGQFQAYLDNTKHIVAKSGARVLITQTNIKRMLGTVQEHCPTLEQIVSVDSIRESPQVLRPEKIGLGDVAFLQFTSGSTSRPKGVTVTHGNLAANIHCIMVDGLRANKETDVGVSWLPLYHDMGLIGFVLAPMMYQVPIVFLPPLLFLKRPVSWFQAVTRHKGTIAFAPNFAYALCRKRIREKDLDGIDLSSWRVAGCGAEPIRAETLQGFASEYAKVGFRKEALLPSYGMAESALAISFTPVEQGLKTIAVDSEALWGEGIVKEVSFVEGANEPLHVVSCGPAFGNHTIAIFDPEDKTSATPLEDGRVGELRIKGPSVTPGYWQDEEKTTEAFAGSYLRTGDLGFVVRGDTYICGRSKEVVIVNGRNYYPQDMEWEASKVAGVRKGNVIAFGARDPSGADADRERVVIALETQEKMTEEKLGPLSHAVRKSVQEGMGLTLDDVVILPPGTLPKTSSGKLQRAKTRQLYEAGELVAVDGGKSSVSKLDVAKEAAKSQLSYLKLAIFGGRKK